MVCARTEACWSQTKGKEAGKRQRLWGRERLGGGLGGGWKGSESAWGQMGKQNLWGVMVGGNATAPLAAMSDWGQSYSSCLPPVNLYSHPGQEVFHTPPPVLTKGGEEEKKSHLRFQ